MPQRRQQQSCWRRKKRYQVDVSIDRYSKLQYGYWDQKGISFIIPTLVFSGIFFSLGFCLLSRPQPSSLFYLFPTLSAPGSGLLHKPSCTRSLSLSLFLLDTHTLISQPYSHEEVAASLSYFRVGQSKKQPEETVSLSVCFLSCPCSTVSFDCAEGRQQGRITGRCYSYGWILCRL